MWGMNLRMGVVHRDWEMGRGRDGTYIGDFRDIVRPL